MSMHRQIWLAIVLSALVAFGGGLISSVINAKIYLESQITQKNIDNANALALTITHGTPNKANAEAAINAMFDSGHYEFIELRDNQNTVISERFGNVQDSKYSYLKKIIRVDPAMGIAEINNGWKQFGTVYIASDVTFAYETLNNTIIHSVMAMLLAGLVSGILSYFILNRITKPINDVIKQVSAISNKDFMTIPETKIPELNKLAKAINKSAHRLRDAFNHEEQKLEEMRKKACSDPLTGIANRGFFISVLDSLLQRDDIKGGILILLRIKDLGEVNDLLGRQKCDAFIQALANELNSYTVGSDDAIAGRLNGADFAVIVPGINKQSEQLVKKVFKNVSIVASRWVNADEHIFMGYTQFTSKSHASDVLAEADKSLSDSESND
jgi:diguanylate cyclase (GGDEF)-like protein